mmetsp:Transcript_11470/g.34817  ORF Transcript_11470/g.34817 Transcript_11470/m.34817 type:complete len:85 (+) Transcript_11470:225-479(+)
MADPAVVVPAVEMLANPMAETAETAPYIASGLAEATSTSRSLPQNHSSESKPMVPSEPPSGFANLVSIAAELRSYHGVRGDPTS